MLAATLPTAARHFPPARRPASHSLVCVTTLECRLTLARIELPLLSCVAWCGGGENSTLCSHHWAAIGRWAASQTTSPGKLDQAPITCFQFVLGACQFLSSVIAPVTIRQLACQRDGADIKNIMTPSRRLYRETSTTRFREFSRAARLMRVSPAHGCL